MFEERKVLIRFLPILMLIHLSALILHADTMDPPDIQTQALEQYLAASLDPQAEARLRLGYYAYSLRGELENLAADLEELISASEQAQLFRESHEAFLLSTDKWAAFNEEIQWNDQATGELSYDSGGGETYLLISSALIRERILQYRQLLDSINRNGAIEFVYGDGTGVIGEY